MDRVEIYTDGSALGNPGRGGWGVVLLWGSLRKEMSGGVRLTTNNRMELTAVCEGLEALTRPCEVTIYSDSKYVVDAIDKGWVFGWEKKGFKDKKNPDLWMRFLEVAVRHKVRMRWVKGHAANPLNERCDVLAKRAAARTDLPIDKGYTDV